MQIMIKNESTAAKAYSKNKRVIFSKLSTTKWNVSPITVHVTYDDEFSNFGTYATREEALAALAAFTEPELINYIT